ncbi:hypothetical protein GT025_11435 [Streptomyces sp. SID4920]|nr:hypothetical protein [Streptomyces sp. SID4920]MYX65497.1 hypothetical protein [Streptomyces sp. SID8373]
MTDGLWGAFRVREGAPFVYGSRTAFVYGRGAPMAYGNRTVAPDVFMVGRTAGRGIMPSALDQRRLS